MVVGARGSFSRLSELILPHHHPLSSYHTHTPTHPHTHTPCHLDEAEQRRTMQALALKKSTAVIKATAKLKTQLVHIRARNQVG